VVDMLGTCWWKEYNLEGGASDDWAVVAAELAGTSRALPATEIVEQIGIG
jgi:hypothetical protein